MTDRRPGPVLWTRRLDWTAHWAAATLAVSTAATIFDAILLQYRRSYFTGGFLASDYITNPVQATGFVAGSLVSDAAVCGVLAALTLWSLGRAGVRRNLALAVASVIALAPIVAANVAEYELVTYLGDAFDFRLLFDLTGRSVGEIIAVSSAHAARFAWVTVGAVGAAIAALWLLLRVAPGREAPMPRMPSWRALAAPMALLLIGTVGTTALRSESDVLDNGLRRKPTGRMLGAVVEMATDVDRDGYGVLGRPDDPDLFDSRVRPYALDVPGNGVDEDGVGGNLPVLAAAGHKGIPPGATWRSTQDVVLVVLESFRADARGAMVGGKPVTPVLDALAAQGVAPRAAYSHNGYTVQSRQHIFSGSVAGDQGRDTLIDDFKRHGYQVAYFSGQDESFGGPQQGIGFDRADVAYDARSDRARRYSDFSTAGSLAVPFDVVEERIGAFLDGRPREQPLFLYVNFHDTHFPYHHRGVQPLVSPTIVAQADISPEHADAVREMYMNTASNVDRAIGNVLTRVRRALGREPGVIVLSDHGESLFDEGFLGHGYSLNDAQTRIPLVVANLPMVIEEPFAQADLRDAIGAALAVPYTPGAKATSRDDPSKTIFQYLGLINRPAQIAVTGASGRTIYDFREGRVQMNGGAWLRPEALAPSDHAAFLGLVHTWERMMLRRAGLADDGRGAGLAF